MLVAERGSAAGGLARGARRGMAGPGAAERRQSLLRALDLPGHMSANAMLAVLNILYTWEEYRATVDRL